MKDKRRVWVAGGAGLLLIVGLLIHVVSGSTAGRRDRPVFSPEWALCGQGDLCIAMQAPCGEWQPVNGTHEEDAAAYYGHLITVVETTGMECMSTNLGRRTPAAYCRAGTCELAQ